MIKGNPKEYLGDIVYAEDAGFAIRIYTSNRIMEYSEIYLEAETADAFVRFWKKMEGRKGDRQMNPMEDLGEGAYAEYDGYAVTLYTNDGFVMEKAICLEPEVLEELLRVIGNWKQMREEATK